MYRKSSVDRFFNPFNFASPAFVICDRYRFNSVNCVIRASTSIDSSDNCAPSKFSVRKFVKSRNCATPRSVIFSPYRSSASSVFNPLKCRSPSSVTNVSRSPSVRSFFIPVTDANPASLIGV